MNETILGFLAGIGAFVSLAVFVGFEIQGKSWNYNPFFLPGLFVLAFLLAVIGMQKLLREKE